MIKTDPSLHQQHPSTPPVANGANNSYFRFSNNAANQFNSTASGSPQFASSAAAQQPGNNNNNVVCKSEYDQIFFDVTPSPPPPARRSKPRVLAAATNKRGGGTAPPSSAATPRTSLPPRSSLAPAAGAQQQPLWQVPGHSLWQKYDHIETHLNAQLTQIRLSTSASQPPIAAIYNPTVYARRMHCAYLKRFLTQPPRVLFVGLCPKPWAQCQTGIPFGWPPAIRDWMQLNEDIAIERPPGELTGRYPVHGMQCQRHDEAARQFWQLMRDVFGPRAGVFFRRCFVTTLCPLAMFEDGGGGGGGGRQVMVTELPETAERERLVRCCTDALVQLVQLMPAGSVRVVSVGRTVDRLVREAYESAEAAGGGGWMKRPAEFLCMRQPNAKAPDQGERWMREAKVWLRTNEIGPGWL